MEIIAENFKISTAYNRIDLRRIGNRVELLSPGGALQSVIDLESPHRLQLGNLESLMAIQLFISPPRRILMLGTAAGSLLHYLRHHHRDAQITAVDIDVELIEQLLGLGYLPAADEKLAYVYDDARHFIACDSAGFDLVLVDVFTGAQSPPWLRQSATLAQLRRLLAPGGAVGFNLLIDSEHDFRNFYRELRRLFDAKTLCLPVAGFENTIAYAFRDAPPLRQMQDWIGAANELAESLDLDLVRTLAIIYNTNPVAGGVL